MASSGLPAPGTVIDRYEVIVEVARGGMAAVLAVRRKSIGGFDKILAMKILLPAMASQRQAVERFLDEARIASRIEHPNVVQVIDIGDHDGMPYILMEFLRGRSVAQLMRAAKHAGITPSFGTRLAILARAAEGLAAAHATKAADGSPLRIVHRDVSPQNIHVGYEGEVKVVDFGIAAARGRLAETTTGEFRGKLAYAAPEQLTRKQTVDQRADVWALGVMTWELLSGRRLFRADDEREVIFKVLQGEVPSLKSVAPAVADDVCAAVARCLERNVDARMASAGELATVLDRAASAAGGERRQDIAQLMGRLFAAERGAEDERLAAAARGDEPPPPLQPGPQSRGGGSLTALSGTAKTRAKPGFVVAAVVAGALVVAGGGVYAWQRTTSSPSSTSGALPASPAPEPSAAPRAKITVQVPVGLSVALVDGRRHDERPLVIELGAGGSARLVLVAHDGRSLKRDVSAGDDGRVLTLPESPPTANASSAPAATSASKPGARVRPAVGGAKPKPSNPLLGDPY